MAREVLFRDDMVTRGMKKLVLVVVGPGIFPGLAVAGSASTQFSVSATVNPNCTISASHVDLGTYDPTITAPLTQTFSAAVRITCSKNAPVTVGLSAGSNSAGATCGVVTTTRAMKSATSYLCYELYKDSAYSTVWGASGAGLLKTTATGKNGTALTVYGKIPSGQDPAPGTFVDTITATVNY